MREVLNSCCCLGIAGVVGVAATPSMAQVGPLVAWGNNANGELEVPSGNYRRVSASGTFSVAIGEDGTLTAWGGFGGGQLNVPSGNTFVDVSAGSGGGVALRADGTLASWGRDDQGQVSQTPSGTFSAIAAADSFRLAMRTTGQLVAWGGTTGSVPQGTILDFDGGSNFGLAVRTDGTLVGWGDDTGGVLSSIPSGSFVAVEAGAMFGVAIAADGSLRSWGAIFTPGGTAPMPSPPPGNDFVDIDAGVSNFVIARRTNGTLVGWGGSGFGAVNVPSGSFIDIAAGNAHGVAIVPSPGSFLIVGPLMLVLCARREPTTR